MAIFVDDVDHLVLADDLEETVGAAMAGVLSERLEGARQSLSHSIYTRKLLAKCLVRRGIRRELNHMNTGLRVEYGDLIFFTVTPDRKHSALVWRLMRARTNVTGPLADDGATS